MIDLIMYFVIVALCTLYLCLNLKQQITSASYDEIGKFPSWQSARSMMIEN
jgi:hypothetical protein